MNSIYDVRKLLMKFGAVIYIGDRLADLELMQEEITELYQVKVITKEQYINAKMLLNKEINTLK